MAARLQLHAGQEASGQAVAVVAQLRGVHGAGFLGVDDGGAPDALQPVARLEIQLRFVAAPGAVGNRHDGLHAVFQALARRLQGHVLDEVTVRVVVHRGDVSVEEERERVLGLMGKDTEAHTSKLNTKWKKCPCTS